MDLIVNVYIRTLNKLSLIHQNYRSRTLFWKGYSFYQQASYLYASGTAFADTIRQKSHITSIFLIATNIT